MTPQDQAASWQANRSDVGWAILASLWGSVFSTLAFYAEDGEGADSVFSILAAIFGFVFLTSVTRVGWRLANSHPRPEKPPRVDRLRRNRSDVRVMVLVGLGSALAAGVVLLIMAIALG